MTGHDATRLDLMRRDKTFPLLTAEVNPMTDLTTTNRRALAHHEKTIQRGLRTFCEVGAALLQIRADNLYAEFGTFEHYCRDRWDFSKTHANRLIDAAVVVTHLTPIGVIPGSEYTARPLTIIRDRDGVIDLKQVEGVWSAAVSEAKERGATLPTAANVEELVTRWKESQRAKDVEPAAADVEPVDDEQPDEPTEQLPIDKDVDPVAGECPNCGSHERGYDRECAKCREPAWDEDGEEESGEDEEEEPPGNPAFEALKEVIVAWRKLYPDVDDATSAAMCENVADQIREAMNS